MRKRIAATILLFALVLSVVSGSSKRSEASAPSYFVPGMYRGGDTSGEWIEVGFRKLKHRRCAIGITFWHSYLRSWYTRTVKKKIRKKIRINTKWEGFNSPYRGAKGYFIFNENRIKYKIRCKEFKYTYKGILKKE